MKWFIGILGIYNLMISCQWEARHVPLLREENIKDLELIIEEYLEKNQTIGMCVGIPDEDSIVFKKYYGFVDLEKKQKVSANTIFSLASISKLITSVSVMLLVEKNFLTLDQSITSFLPELPRLYQSITVRHLLNHTSGLQSMTFLADSLKQFQDIDLREDNGMKEFLTEQHILHAPGEYWRYNNTGYLLLSKIIEHVTGNSYADFLKDYILEPARMPDTGLCSQEPLKSNYHSHYLVESPLTHYLMAKKIFEQLSGEGGICSTTEDLLLFIAALENGLIIDKEHFQQMLEPTQLNDGTIIPYGLGVRLGSSGGPEKFGHTGGAISDKTILIHYHNEHISLVILANSEPSEVDWLAYEIERYLFAPVKPFNIQIPDTSLKYAGRYQWGEYIIDYQFDLKHQLWERIDYGDRLDSLDYIYFGNHRFYTKSIRKNCSLS